MNGSTGLISIIGKGAVGTCVATLLEPFYRPVELVGRDEKVNKDSSLVMVATKAFDFEAALFQQIEKVGTTPCVVLCNGYLKKQIQDFTEKNPGSSILRGIVSFGVKESDSGFERIGMEGKLFIGSYDEDFSSAILPNGGFIQQVANIERMEIEKWVFNTIINTLCGAYRLPTNGAVIQYRAEIDILLGEIFDLLRSPAFSGSKEIVASVLADSGVIKDKLFAIINDTSANENSMARDIRLGRPTEKEYFSGMFVQAESRMNSLHQLI